MRNKKVFIGLVVVVACIALVVVASNWSAIGSKLANPMRKLLGIERVAQLETVLFDIQDWFAQLKYKMGMAEPVVPWSATPEVSSLPANLPTATSGVTATPAQDGTPVAEATPAATPTPTGWTLPNAKPFGELEGEGMWVPYIYNEAGEVVALRTFLQPDPERPYAIVAVAAFDMRKTNLHFVLGVKEPGNPKGPGLIPAEDKQAGKLLAAFNGGFIAEHGHYGAMSDGRMPLGAKNGLATLVIYPDGQLRLGEWGTDIDPNLEYQAFRQNAIPIIHNGEINPKVETGTLIEWGANIDGAIVTIRSGIGLSEDNNVLYYFAGPKLSMPTLANAMYAAGAYNSMLLDINPTHAHFTAVKEENGELVAEPLFPEEMNIWVDRYIRAWPWDQDFFYVTAK